MCALLLLSMSRCTDEVTNDQTSINLDQIVEQTMEHWDAPGVILTIVKDGEVLVNKGFGTTKVAGGEPVTPQTLATVSYDLLTKTNYRIVPSLLFMNRFGCNCYMLFKPEVVGDILVSQFFVTCI